LVNSTVEFIQFTDCFLRRFCKICYFFEGGGKGAKSKMFHAQWYLHGSKTILQETAHSQSLYLTNTCDDLSAACIFQRCDVRMLEINEMEPIDEAKPESRDFHCRWGSPYSSKI
jgi:DNA (cytosine-5)-methyltransferase 1